MLSLMKAYDVIVLGGGIAGLSVARELAKRKARVLLIEQEKKGAVASRAAAGILDPYTEANQDSPFLTLGLKASEFYSDFLREIAGKTEESVEYKKLGILYLAVSPEDDGLLKDRFEWQKKRSLPVEFVSGNQIQKIEPLASRSVRSGIFYPEIAKLNANKLITRLLEATKKVGVEIRTGVKNVSVSFIRGKVQGVKISGTLVQSGSVVIAAGSWSGLQKLGFKIDVSPVRGQILLLCSKQNQYPRHILHSMRWAYVIPWPEKRLLIGSTLESVGFKCQVTRQGKEDILNRVSEIMDGIREFPIESSWAGLRPFARKGVPLVGPTHVSGLYLATGYYKSGILIGPFVGKLLAEGILSKKFSPLLEPFFQK